MKQFKTSKTYRNRQGDTIVVSLNEFGKNTTILAIANTDRLAIANTDRSIEHFLSVHDRQQAEVIVEVLTKYVQAKNGQTELL